MQKTTIKITTVDEYISLFPPEVKVLLKQLRKIIRTTAPDAEEVLSYQMPAYKYNGMLIYFAAHKNHIGLYPFKTAITAFQKELTKYEGAKGTVRFPFDKPLPEQLVTQIVKFRVKENLLKASLKKKK
jgi:uncharacterized protein YdhG (YjbR/CyaY superfamily)